MSSHSKYGDLLGKRFGRLLVVAPAGRSPQGHVLWLCKCDCGTEKVNTASNLVRGNVKSCGCYHDEVRRRKRPGTGHFRKVPCKKCGKELDSYSDRQVYCSVECSFLDRIKDADNGCKEWQGSLNNQGYGVLRGPDKKMIQAHRYAWERANGKIPDGMCVCHKCDNRRCVNIDHLFIGTWYDNNHDRSLKGRSGKRVFSDEERKRYSIIFRGEGSRAAKLTEEQARAIFADTSGSYRDIAKKYGVSKPTVAAIKNKRQWRHIHEINTAQSAPNTCCIRPATECADL